MHSSHGHLDCIPSFIDVPIFSDSRGQLMVTEFEDLPFFPKRLFVQSVNERGTVRGQHAHRSCSQLLVVIKGSVKVSFESCAGIQTEVLKDSSVGLLIPPMVWASQTFQSRNGKVLVLASEPYSEADYIRDKNEFGDLLGIHLAK